MRRSIGLEYKQFFSTVLANNFFPWFLHPSGLLGFCAPNPGRLHKACSRLLGCGCLGGIPLALEERRIRPGRMFMAEARLRRLRCLLEVIAVGKSGCWLTDWRHCLGVFPGGGGIGIGELCNLELADVGEKHVWFCDCTELSLGDLFYRLQFSDVSREVWRVGRDRGCFFGQLNIIWVTVIPSNICHQHDFTVWVGGLTEWHGLTFCWSYATLVSFASPVGRRCCGVGGGGIG